MDALQQFGIGIALALMLLVAGVAVALLLQLIKIPARLPRPSKKALRESRRTDEVREELMRQGFTEREAQQAADETRA